MESIKDGYVFCCFNKKEVVFSGQSRGTFTSLPRRGESVKNLDLFPDSKEKIHFKINGSHFWWWNINCEVDVSDTDETIGWRETLESILDDVGANYSNGRDEIKKSINGVIGYINGVISEKRNVDNLFNTCLQKLNSKDHLKKIVRHKEFKLFLLKRVNDLLRR